jgi:hypothetical protein
MKVHRDSREHQIAMATDRNFDPVAIKERLAEPFGIAFWQRQRDHRTQDAKRRYRIEVEHFGDCLGDLAGKVAAGLALCWPIV